MDVRYFNHTTCFFKFVFAVEVTCVEVIHIETTMPILSFKLHDSVIYSILGEILGTLQDCSAACHDFINNLHETTLCGSKVDGVSLMVMF